MPPRSPSRSQAVGTKRSTRAGRHILVIGGSRGAGAEAVRLFSERRDRVSVLARTAPTHPVQRVCYGEADLCKPSAVRHALRKFCRVHGAFDAIVFFQRYRGNGDTWRGELQTSLTATKQTIELLTSEFQFQRGSIVIVSSVNAGLISRNVSLGYHIAKASLNQMTRYYAVHLGPLGIRVNSVSPGTFIKAENREALTGNPALLNLYRQIVPLGRLGTAGEVAKTISFLSGAEASFITGQDIIVDGGASLVYQESLARQLVPLP